MSLINDRSSFEVTTWFEGQRAVLFLHGRVESLAAFDLWEALVGAIDIHNEELILDLSCLDFIGAAGLVALASAEKRFADAGVELTIRTPPRVLRQFLSSMEPTEVARLDQALARLGYLGQEQVGETSSSIAPSSSVDLRNVIPTASDVVGDTLQLVVELAQTSVSGADGVSVSLMQHGDLVTMAATDATVREMDTYQYATGEGPCVDASYLGHWFHAHSLDSESRWPSFTPRARALGISSILSSPLTALEDPVGSLNIYSRTASTFDIRAQEMAAAFARKASVILTDASAGASDAQLALRFQEALRSRVIISTAGGIVMESEDIDEDDAFTRLLRQSIKREESPSGDVGEKNDPLG
jgi:anti-anti-sigma regulatory factor